jgi:hypothetical protein
VSRPSSCCRGRADMAGSLSVRRSAAAQGREKLPYSSLSWPTLPSSVVHTGVVGLVVEENRPAVALPVNVVIGRTWPKASNYPR